VDADEVYQDFDRDSAEHRNNRNKIRSAVEKAANDSGFDGVVTAWMVIAEVCDSPDGTPRRTLWVDDAYHDNYGLVSWTRRGLLNEAMDEWGF
jgi:hypothetical protein